MSGRFKYIGEFNENGRFYGDGAREYDHGRAELGTFKYSCFYRNEKNERLEKMGLDAFKQE